MTVRGPSRRQDRTPEVVTALCFDRSRPSTAMRGLLALGDDRDQGWRDEASEDTEKLLARRDRGFAGVVVEAAAGLAAEPARLDTLGERWARAVRGIGMAGGLLAAVTLLVTVLIHVMVAAAARVTLADQLKGLSAHPARCCGSDHGCATFPSRLAYRFRRICEVCSTRSTQCLPRGGNGA